MILCGVALVLSWVYYSPPPPSYRLNRSRTQLLKELDYVGIGLFSGGLGVFLMGVIWAGGQSKVWAPQLIIRRISVYRPACHPVSCDRASQPPALRRMANTSGEQGSGASQVVQGESTHVHASRSGEKLTIPVEGNARLT
jgi:hypothetical protein